MTIDDFQAMLRQAVALHQVGRLLEAKTIYEQFLTTHPGHPDALHLLGVVFFQLGNSQKAVDLMEQAIGINPNNPAQYHNIGRALKRLGQPYAALANYDMAISLRPDYADAWNNRGVLLRDLKCLNEALDSYGKALALKPRFAAAWNNRGVVLRDLGRLEEALVDFDKAIALKPDQVEAYVNRAFVLRGAKRLDEALDNYSKALSLKPDYPFLLGDYLHAKMMACDWNSFEDNINKYEAGIRTRKCFTPPFAALGLTDDPNVHKAAAEIYCEAKWPVSYVLGPIRKVASGMKLRIGYYSADFHNHATSYLTAELFEKHDAEKFELYAFSFGPDKRDHMRGRISAAFGKFMHVRETNDRDIAKISREIGIDIAVDLKGHTQDSRPGIFAEGCAPIQVNYLGYPAAVLNLIESHSHGDFAAE